MFKKQKKRGNSGKTDAVQKGKDKVVRVRLGGFATITAYDLATWVGIGLSIGFVLIYGFQGNQRGVRWSVVSLIFFILIMLAVRAKQHFWDEEEEKTLERPELSLEFSGIEFARDKPPQINLVIKNRGQTTAYNIRFQGQDFLKPRGFTDRLAPIPNSVWDTYPTLAVGAMATTFSLGGAGITAQQIADIESGDLLYLHFTRGRYEDERGGVYPFDLCFKYHPGYVARAGYPKALSISPAEHWPEEMNKSGDI